MTVENDALGGTSSRSYMSNPNLWPKVVAKLQPGDFVIMQFGHNDDTRPPESDTLRYRSTIKGNGEETVEGPVQGGGMETIHSYGWYIRQYIRQTKEKGATPIVCSMIPRNSWKNGKVNRVSVAGYGLWAKQAAEQGGALFVPLNDLVADKYDQMGQEKVGPEMFALKDGTHTSWAGAVVNAACVVEGLKALDVPVLKAALVKEPKVPAEPDVKAPATRGAASAPAK